MKWTFKREGPFRMGSVNRFFSRLASAVQEMLDLVSGRIFSMQVKHQSLLEDCRALVERIEAHMARSRRLESSEGQAKAELATANAALLETQESEKAPRRVRSTLEARAANLADKCQRLEAELDETNLAKQAFAVELCSRKRAEREAANADPAEEIRTLREQCEALTELSRRLESVAWQGRWASAARDH